VKQQAAVADQAAIATAAAVLEAGGLVAFPTETVYGLGADAENPAAVARIYEAKGRPNDHPVIVHVAPGADLDYWVTDIPDEARQLAAAFWPGPLTLILKRASHIPDAVSGGQDTVGIRCPSHPVAIALLSAFKGGKGGVAAPSANKFGNVSPTTAQHVRDEFGLDAHDDGPTATDSDGDACSAELLSIVLEGGPSQVGIESTIVDLSRLATHGPVLLRPGHISAQQIADVIGQLPAAPDQAAPRASGTLESHYAPRTPVTMLEQASLIATLAQLRAKGVKVAVISHALPTLQVPQKMLPGDPGGYAYGLYAALRDMDQTGSDLILVETPPQDPQWMGVNDRLRRSVFGSAGIIASLLK
jgi:L-threonylcarbamoyladenylate synthase